MLKLKIIFAVFLIGILTGCGDKPQSSTPTASPTAAYTPPQKTEVVVDAMDLSYAMFAGNDGKGKNKDVYFLEMEGNRVKLVNAFVYGKDTSDSSVWLLLIGDNTPRILCQQRSKEGKMVVANLDKKLSNATVVGDYDSVMGNKVYLKECTITSTGKE